jgi:hypothetical protein
MYVVGVYVVGLYVDGAIVGTYEGKYVGSSD